MIKGLIFVLEETVLNSQELKRKAHERTLRGFGIKHLVELRDYAKIVGLSDREAAEIMHKTPGVTASLAEYRRIWAGHYAKLTAEFIAPHEGVINLFKHARERRLEIAIVGQGSQLELVRTLQKTGLSEWSRHLVSVEDGATEASNPFLKALQLIFGNGKNTLAIVGTNESCDSALKANLSVIATRNDLNINHGFRGSRRTLHLNGMANAEHFLECVLEP
jgi:beta-phosphoglucomutase-like phosphatase (HAD superfamily)